MTMPRDTPDHLLRETLRTKENLHDLLESALPEVIENFDFTRVEEIPREFFTGEWRGREADLIFEVGYRVEEQATPALVGVMVEHQTNVDQWIPFRALFLLVSYWERRWRQWEEATERPRTFRLPPVFCLVLYTGETTWGSNTNVRQLLDEPEELHQYAPDWGPQFWNLADRSADDLLSGPPWMKLMAIVRVESEAEAEFTRVLREVDQRLESLEETAKARWSQLMRAVYSSSIFRRPASEHPQIRQILERGSLARVEEVRGMEKTIAQAWKEEARIEQARIDVQNVLEVRFGSIPEPIIQKIAALDDLGKLSAAHKLAIQIPKLDDFQP